MVYKVAISGSRHYISAKSWKVHEAITHEWRKHHYDVEFIVGDCPTGVDKIALEFFKVAGIKFKRFEADWDRLGKAAGPERNHRMIDYGADKLICFPEDDSRGTKEIAKYASHLHIPVVFPELPEWARWAAPMAIFEED